MIKYLTAYLKVKISIQSLYLTVLFTHVRVVEGSACSKLSKTDSHLLESIPVHRGEKTDFLNI